MTRTSVADRITELAELVAAAETAFSDRDADALGALGWEPGDLTDADARLQAAAVFRAQGRTLAATVATGALAAHAALGDGERPLARVMTARARSYGDEVEVVCVGNPRAVGTVVVDLGDDGIHVGPRPRVTVPLVGALDPLVAVPAVVARADLELVSLGDDADAMRRRALVAARFAIANEILGTCDAAMALAVEHVGLREQFGAPLGSFQAVQHLLAEAAAQCHAVEVACDASVARRAHSERDVIAEAMRLKALAGRNGRRVLQASLQALGAIGFTEEHAHHGYLRRMLTLDALFGSAARLVDEIGADALATGQIWQHSVLDGPTDDRGA